jgi:hypothetical protein
VPVAEAGAAPAAALRTVPDALVADCAGAPADGTSAVPTGPAVEPETELAVPEDAVPAAEPTVLLTELPPAVELLAPEPAELALTAAEPECPVRACDAPLTVEPTTELAVETGEPGGGGSVAACACRENTSMMKKIPAARIASCIARRAMRRTIGCGMSYSHPPDS